MSNPHLPLLTALILMFNVRLCTKNCLQQAQSSQGSGELNSLCHGQGSPTLPPWHGEFPQLQLFPRGLRFKLHQLFPGAALALGLVLLSQGSVRFSPPSAQTRSSRREKSAQFNSKVSQTHTGSPDPGGWASSKTLEPKGSFADAPSLSCYENSKISSFAAAAEIPCFPLLPPQNAHPDFLI